MSDIRRVAYVWDGFPWDSVDFGWGVQAIGGEDMMGDEIDALWRAIIEAAVEYWPVGKEEKIKAETALRSYADLADSATTFDPEEQFDRDVDAHLKEKR